MSLTEFISDYVKPIFTSCPSNMEVFAGREVNYTSVALPSINATDNSGQQPVIKCEGQSDKYYTGSNSVKCTATDVMGNKALCQFNIFVKGTSLVLSLKKIAK